MSDEGTSQAAPAPAGGGGSKMLPILLVMNTLLIAGVLVFVMKKPAATAPAPAPQGTGGAPASPPIEVPGPMLKLENFIIQIKTSEAERYVRMAFDLELKGEPDRELVTQRTSQIRDAVIAYFSDRTLEELRGSDGMLVVKQNLLKKVDELVPGQRVKAIYITDFIVQ